MDPSGIAASATPNRHCTAQRTPHPSLRRNKHGYPMGSFSPQSPPILDESAFLSEVANQQLIMASDDRHHSSRSRHSHYHSDSHRSRSRDSHRSRDSDRHRSSHHSGSRHDSHRDSHRERSRTNETRSVSRAAVDQGSKGKSSVRYETFQKGSANSNGSASVPALPAVGGGVM